nr:MAG TPA: hypothetical protein [Caudoviricetes sp.]
MLDFPAPWCYILCKLVCSRGRMVLAQAVQRLSLFFLLPLDFFCEFDILISG